MDDQRALPQGMTMVPGGSAENTTPNPSSFVRACANSLTLRSIRSKVLATLVSLTILTIAILIQVSTAVVENALLESHIEDARTISRVVETVFPDVTDLRGPLARERLEAIGAGRTDIRRLVIVVPEDGDWRIQASKRESDFLQTIDLGIPASIMDEPMAVPVPSSAAGSYYFLYPLASRGSMGLTLVLEVEIGSIQQAVEFMLERTLAITLIVIVVLVFLLYWGSEILLLRPIRQLHRQAAEIERGNLDARSGIRRKDEIGSLAHGFDRMAEALERAAWDNRRLYSELERRWLEASRNAVTDYVTSLHNHRYLQLRLQEELAQTMRAKTPVSLLLVDIDHFKALNDAYGHLAGDEIIAQIAAVIRASVRGMDIPCRYGGDEFGILLPGAGVDEALVVGERIRRAVADHVFHLNVSGPPRVTVSVGVATAPQDAGDRDGLIKAADDALYYGKNLGRNQVWACRDIIVESSADDRPEWWEQLQLNAIHSLATAVDVRDSYTQHHSDEVARLSMFIGRQLGLSALDLRNLLLAGTVHDVGKIGIPDSILGKNGRLTDQEFNVIRSHPVLGQHIVEQVRGLEDIARLVRAHHERWDGRGYPDGLSGEHIPLLSRIISVADSYHAMTSARPYRQALPVETAIGELRRVAGTQLDSRLVDVFCQAVERGDLNQFPSVELAGHSSEHRTTGNGTKPAPPVMLFGSKIRRLDSPSASPHATRQRGDA